jgi:hypothetical protein
MPGEATVIQFSNRPDRPCPLIPPWVDDVSTTSCEAALSLLLPAIRALARLARQRAVPAVGD